MVVMWEIVMNFEKVANSMSYDISFAIDEGRRRKLLYRLANVLRRDTKNNNKVHHRSKFIWIVECGSKQRLAKGKLAHLEQALLPTPLLVEPAAVVEAYFALFNAQQEVACLMLVSMTLDLQKKLEKFTACDMLYELKTILQGQANQELFGTIKTLHACKLDEGHMGNTIPEMHAILKLSKKGIPKKVVAHVFLAIRGAKIKKNDKTEVHYNYTAEDDLEVYSIDDLDLDWISAHNF
ncbi:hypothetical protein Tco_0143588 [Tanacetum coccineum]